MIRWCRQSGWVHIMLIELGWKEMELSYFDGSFWVKMYKPETFNANSKL